MYTLQHYAKHIALWLLPLFALWWFSLNTVLLPTIATIEDSLLQATYQRARASLNSDNLSNWHIETKLLLAEKSAAGNFQTWSIEVGNMTALTLGLPMAWILLLASPQQRLRKTLIASAIVFTLIVLTIWLKLNALMLDLLAAEQPFAVYVSATIQITHQPVAAWPVDLFNLATEFIAYINIIIAPALLAYWLNRDWWQAQYQLKFAGQ